MNNYRSAKEGKTGEPSLEAPVTAFIQLDAKSSVPSRFQTPGAFTITRLQSPASLPERVTKISPIPALLLSVSIRALPRKSYQLWCCSRHSLPFVLFTPTLSTSIPARDAGQGLPLIMFTIQSLGQFSTTSPKTLGSDVSATIVSLCSKMTWLWHRSRKVPFPFLGRSDGPSVLALDQFSLILGAHLIQRYGAVCKIGPAAKGGLAPWQMRRASEILRENLRGHIRLAELSDECGLSVSHFARSFKISFGISAHQWLIQQRIEHAKELMRGTGMSLLEVAIHSGFYDHAALTRAFQQFAGVSPGRWRRQYLARPE